jgi:hypothetical protein
MKRFSCSLFTPYENYFPFSPEMFFRRFAELKATLCQVLDFRTLLDLAEIGTNLALILSRSGERDLL